MTQPSLAIRRTEERERIPPAGLVTVAALGALLFRSQLLALPLGTRTILLITLTAAVAIPAILVPVAADARGAHPLAILIAGLAAVLLATAAAGSVVPAPLGVWSLPLALLAAVAEEAVFRRAMFAWLAPLGPIVAIAATAMAFASIHVPLYGAAAFPVDLGAGLLLSWQRWAGGTWTVPAATHAAANVLAVALR